MSNVIPIGCITSLDLPVDRILDEAKGKGLTGVVLLGMLEDGGQYFASSIADGGDILWLLEMCKKQLLEMAL